MMELERCFRCERSEEQVKLLDVIYEKEIVKICEECSALENLPVIRKPTTFQLKATERPYTVYERLARAAGLKDKADTYAKKKEQEDIRKITGGISLDNLRKPRDFSKPSQKTPVSKNEPANLIDNFHWQIMMARRKRGISQKHLADAIVESESAIRMIESGSLPDDAERLIGKIEQYLRIKLRKNKVSQDIQIIKGQVQESFMPEDKPEPVRIIKFNPKDLKNITIADLQRMKKEKEMMQESLKKQEKSEKENEDLEIIDLDKEDIKT